jgi:hypothetical protein
MGPLSTRVVTAEPDKEKPEATGPSKDKDHPRKRPPGAEDPRRDSDPFRDLSPEQREKLREAVRKAWSDPSVLQARDELKTAAETYQNAIYSAIKRSSPDMAEAVDLLRKNSSSELKMYSSPGMGRGPGGGGPGPSPGGGPSGRGWKEVEGFMTMESPSFLRELPADKQKIYRDAHRKAMESAGVKAKVESLKSLRQEDENMRKKRIDAIRGVHLAIRRALIEADSRVSEFLPENRRPGSEGKGGERSKGNPQPPAPRKPRPEAEN